MFPDERQINAVLYELVHKAYDVTCIIHGVPYPTGKEEWIKFTPLSFVKNPSRRGDISQRVYVEITCYSLLATYRKDKRYDRQWELAKMYADLFDQQDIQVETSCISFKEPRKVYLDLRSTGDFAGPIKQTSPQLNVDAVLIEIEGDLIQPKGIE